MHVLDAASVQGRALRGDWLIFVAAGAAVALLVWALIVFPIVRWREREGRAVPQFANNVPLEIAWTIAPVLIVALLFYPTYTRERAIEALARHPDATVEITGFQWSWRIAYPGEGVTVAGTPTQPPLLVLPLGKTTRVTLLSADVNHSLWIPAFLFKRDAIPGVRNEFDVTPTRAGVYRAVCAEYCGLDHALMTMTVRVVPASDFGRWLASQRKATS